MPSPAHPRWVQIVIIIAEFDLIYQGALNKLSETNCTESPEFFLPRGKSIPNSKTHVP